MASTTRGTCGGTAGDSGWEGLGQEILSQVIGDLLVCPEYDYTLGHCPLARDGFNNKRDVWRLN